MKIKLNKKYTMIALYSIIVFAVCLLLVSFVFFYDRYTYYIKEFFIVSAPVIWGIVIAYLLNPVMKYTEVKLKKLNRKDKVRNRTIRGISVLISFILLISIITFLITMAVPEVSGSIEKIFNNFPSYMGKLENYVNSFLEDNPKINNFFINQFESISGYLNGLIIKLQPQMEKIIVNISSGAVSLFVFMKNFLIGLIISVYLLCAKETLIGQFKKVLHAFIPADKCEKILRIGSRINTTFIKYISAKAIDSFLVSLIMFVLLTIFRIPYAVLVSCIIGLVNMIPFFGPFIGGIPSALLILAENPQKGILFIIIVLVVQQLDGNIIDPKISGQVLGLPAFWIVSAVLVGSGLFGFLGMVLSVPVFSVIYVLIRDFINERLTKKHLPVKSSDYIGSASPPDT